MGFALDFEEHADRALLAVLGQKAAGQVLPLRKWAQVLKPGGCMGTARSTHAMHQGPSPQQR